MEIRDNGCNISLPVTILKTTERPKIGTGGR
jgi:hypothetical protein